MSHQFVKFPTGCRESTRMTITVYPMKYVHTFYIRCILLPTDFTHILQGYFIGSGAIMIAPEPVK